MSPAPVPAPSVLAGLKQALMPHAPFSAMSDRDLGHIVRASRLRYFATGEAILTPAPDRPAHCYVIRQGTSAASGRAAPPTPRRSSSSLPGELFPLGALLARRGVTSVYRAAQDTFCLEFPTAVFDTLIATSAVFQDFCTRRLAHLLDLSRARLQAEYAATVTEQRGFSTPLGSLPRIAPLTCRPDTAIGDAPATMEQHRIGTMPVVDDDAKPLGIFTRQDVIGRVVLPQRPLTTPIREVMSTPVVTLPAGATAGDAALVMAQRGIRHVVVLDDRAGVAGVVSERDLFSLQRLSVRELASTIRRAGDIDALVQCAGDIRELSHSLVAQGAAAGHLTRMISSLNDQLTIRILELLAPQFDLAGIALCWLGMGSEGRSEQTIATDQDNGLIFTSSDGDAAPDASASASSRSHEPSTRRWTAAATRCARAASWRSNPRWCASLSEWKAAFANWIDRGDPDSLLAASIFFDFRALWGELAPRRRAARRRGRARAGQPAIPEADVRQRAAEPAAVELVRRAGRGGRRGRRRGHRSQDERQRSLRRRGAHLRAGRRRHRHQYRRAAAAGGNVRGIPAPR